MTLLPLSSFGFSTKTLKRTFSTSKNVNRKPRFAKEHKTNQQITQNSKKEKRARRSKKNKKQTNKQTKKENNNQQTHQLSFIGNVDSKNPFLGTGWVDSVDFQEGLSFLKLRSWIQEWKLDKAVVGKTIHTLLNQHAILCRRRVSKRWDAGYGRWSGGGGSVFRPEAL
mmetsp:Transcript_5239/g.10696  ORF Transcript_5239/g.10696 Transcript_5239/m.10696 type:complete len:168 (-) Transcript_5239:1826-2329(-)